MFLCPSQHQNSPTHVLPFFPPDSTDLSLKCEDSKALSPQTCDFFFFFQKISRSNLWLTDPWQLQISLFLSLLALHLVEKLSDSHLHQAAQVFIMCMHTEYPIWCTPQRLQPSARTLQTACTAAIYPAAFLIFIAQNPPHLLFFFLRRCLHSEIDRCKCGSCARTHRGKCAHFCPRACASKRNLQWKLRAINAL